MHKQTQISIALFTLINFSTLFSRDPVSEIKTLREFQSFINSDDKPVIIKFYAPWCGACKKMNPVFANSAQKFGDSAHFAAINVDNKELQKALELFGIQGIPTIVYKKTGFEDQEAFNNRLSHFLGDKKTEAKPKNPAKKKAIKKIRIER